MTVLGREPALISAFVAIALNLALTFGLSLTVAQLGLINALLVAGMALFVRQQVTPVASPMLPLGTPVLVQGTEDQPPADAVVALKAV